MKTIKWFFGLLGAGFIAAIAVNNLVAQAAVGDPIFSEVAQQETLTGVIRTCFLDEVLLIWPSSVPANLDNFECIRRAPQPDSQGTLQPNIRCSIQDTRTVASSVFVQAQAAGESCGFISEDGAGNVTYCHKLKAKLEPARIEGFKTCATNAFDEITTQDIDQLRIWKDSGVQATAGFITTDTPNNYVTKLGSGLVLRFLGVVE